MKLLFLSILALLTGATYSQEKYIEVTVSDTVLAEANTYVYKIVMSNFTIERYMDRIVDTGNGRDHAAITDRLLNAARVHFDSLLSVIRQKGYTVLPMSPQDTFYIDEQGQRPYFRSILTHSLDSLSQLYQLLRNEKNITAYAVQYADESSHQKDLYKKLIATATSKAKIIASYSGRQLGKILFVEEKPVEKGGGWTSYPPLSALGDSEISGWHTTIYPAVQMLNRTSAINNLIPLANTLVVRFAIE